MPEHVDRYIFRVWSVTPEPGLETFQCPTWKWLAMLQMPSMIRHFIQLLFLFIITTQWTLKPYWRRLLEFRDLPFTSNFLWCDSERQKLSYEDLLKYSKGFSSVVAFRDRLLSFEISEKDPFSNELLRRCDTLNHLSTAFLHYSICEALLY